MPAPSFPSAGERRPLRYLLVVALAYAGATIGYLPFLSLLLPMKVERIAGDGRIGVMAAAVIAGAVASSLSNILFGWLSDRSAAAGAGRRRWLILGTALTAGVYLPLAATDNASAIVAGVVIFQCAVNALIAPLMAIMADEIPDGQKGLAGGLLSLGPPAASGLAAILVGTAALDEPARFGAVAAAVIACTLPLALLPAGRIAAPAVTRAEAALLRRDLVIAWIARLLLQVAGNVLALYLLYYFESIAPGVSPAVAAHRVGQLLLIAYAVPLPVALLLGRLSDRIGRRKPILLGAGLLAAAGLVAMASAQDGAHAIAGFIGYAIGSQVFLSLHAAFAMQLLPDPAHRGRDLGLVNLTNTLPALLGPLLAWALATPQDFAPLLLLLAGLTLAGSITMLAVRGRR